MSGRLGDMLETSARLLRLHTGSNSLDELALYVGLKGFDLQVLDPPELIGVLRSLSERLRRGTVQGQV